MVYSLGAPELRAGMMMGEATHANEGAAALITEDIERFWRAIDAAPATPLAEALDTHYLQPAVFVVAGGSGGACSLPRPLSAGRVPARVLRDRAAHLGRHRDRQRPADRHRVLLSHAGGVAGRAQRLGAGGDALTRRPANHRCPRACAYPAAAAERAAHAARPVPARGYRTAQGFRPFAGFRRSALTDDEPS